MITDDELRQIMPKCPAARRVEYLPFINEAMEEFEINNYLRKAAFLALLAVESLELTMEYRDSGARYEAS
jgi:predicted chitinase